LPLIALLTGLLIGWWVIGWWLWPVTYNNALPPDLRAAERDQYLMLVAESYATSGNTQQARDRLSAWPAEQLALDLSRLESRLASEDARRAGQMRALAGAVGAARPAASPTAPPATAPAGSVSSLLSRVCTIGLWALLVLAGLVGLVYLWNRFRSARAQRPAGPDIPGGVGMAARGVGRTPAQIAADAKQTWPAGREQPPLTPTAPPAAEELQAPAEAAETPAAPSVIYAPPSTEPARPMTGGGARVGDFRSVYRMGEPDFDEAFDINDQGGVHLGACGVSLAEPVGRNRDQAAALQVWLWDTKDPDTRVNVLLSEAVFRDMSGLRERLAAGHEVVQVRPGAQFELETYQLRLVGSVERIDYAEQEPVYGIFAELMVRMQVYRR
jgi:hypothetical protein